MKTNLSTIKKTLSYSKLVFFVVLSLCLSIQLKAQSWSGTETLNSFLPNVSNLVNADNMDVNGIAYFNDTCTRTNSFAFTQGVLAGKSTISNSGVRYYLPYPSAGQVQATAYSTPAFMYNKFTQYLHVYQSDKTDGPNKFSSYSNPSAFIASLEFNVLFDKGGATNEAANYTFSLGANNVGGGFAASYTSGTASTTIGGIFAALNWQIAVDGTIGFKYRNAVATGGLGDFVAVPSAFVFTKGTAYLVKLYTNNTAVNQYYTDALGVEYIIAPQTFDLWVNGNLVAQNLPSLRKATGTGLDAGNNVGAYSFEGVTALSNKTEFARLNNILLKYVATNTTKSRAQLNKQDTVTSPISRLSSAVNVVSIGARGWASNSVNAVVFRKNSIVTYKDSQYIAFYDSASNVVLGKRKLGDSTWVLRTTLFTGTTSDAHNDISIMADGDGYLHISWDHHGNALRYAKSVAPGSLELTSKMPMTGLNETNVTYPEFYSMPNGDLIFMYRDGASGNGNVAINRYDLPSKTWTQIQSNLISGENSRNAYCQSTIDKFGYIHISWVWRETSDVATNHDLSYAVSKDGGITWLKSTGETYALPITLSTSETIYTIPQSSELINQTSMICDEDGYPYIATYWKDATDIAPQYHLVYKNATGWHNDKLAFRTSNFSLSGSGTKAIPISRPQVVVWKKNGDVNAMMIFRDAERNSKISVAINNKVGTTGSWRVADASTESVGDWEPSFDTELWKQKQQLHVFMQYMLQADGEGATTTAPQPVRLMQIDTAFVAPVIVSTRVQKFNGTETVGLFYLPNVSTAPTTLSGVISFNKNTPVATATAVTAVTGGVTTTSTTTTEYFVPKLPSSGGVARLQAVTDAAFTYTADASLLLRQSNIAASVNKFSIHNLSSSATFSLAFNMEFNTTGTTDQTAFYACTFGRESGTLTYNNNVPSISLATNATGVFGGLAWAVAADGTIAFQYRSGGGSYTLASNMPTDNTLATYYTPFTFHKYTKHNVKVYANNTGTLTQYYTEGTAQFTLLPATYDVWVDNIKVFTGLPSLRKATNNAYGTASGNTGASQNSFAFEGLLPGGTTDEYLKLSNIEWKAVSTNVTVLPLTWQSFTATKTLAGALLNWSTSSETNTKAFVVERSADGINFATVAAVAAAGNSSIEKQYAYTDTKPLEGISFYRIKQVDLDGAFTYSAIQSINYPSIDNSFKVYPSFITNGATTIYAGVDAQKLEVVLVDVLGKVLYSKTLKSITLGQQLLVPMIGFKPGMYILQLNTEKGKMNTKLVIR